MDKMTEYTKVMTGNKIVAELVEIEQANVLTGSHKQVAWASDMSTSSMPLARQFTRLNTELLSPTSLGLSRPKQPPSGGLTTATTCTA